MPVIQFGNEDHVLLERVKRQVKYGLCCDGVSWIRNGTGDIRRS